MTAEPITDRDREIMRRARGAIVRHAPTGLIGHAYPHDPIPDEYMVVEDYRDLPAGVQTVAVEYATTSQLDLFDVAA